MRSLVSLSPFGELRRVAEMMDRTFTPVDNEARLQPAFNVPLDIWEKDGNIIIKAAAPGVKAQDLDLTIEDGVLTLSGEVRNEHEEKQNEGRVYQREFRYGRFSRSIRLPDDVDEEQIDAELSDGFVMVTIPRKQLPQTQPRRLQVRSSQTKAIDANKGPAGEEKTAQENSEAKNATAKR